jgi:flavin reductase (DIM6/NTAB) family NADH-FMN oxidoreductase RutF
MSRNAQPRPPAPPGVRSKKVDLPLSIAEWRPAPLVGQVVLVTTVNKDGTTNIAPKCWASMVASTPPTLAFNCNLEHLTAQNILRTREFVVNVPGAEMASAVWATGHLPHPRPVEAAGFTPLEAIKVKPPRAAECRVHLECRLDRHLKFGKEVLLIGRIVAASADSTVTTAKDPFASYRTFVYLEVGTYAIIGRARRVHRTRVKDRRRSPSG